MPSTFERAFYEPEHDSTFDFLPPTPERVKKLREAAGRAGLDIKIADCSADPSATPAPPQHVKEDR